MDVPITLAIGLAIVTSLWETSLSGEHAYFDAALALTFFLLAGRYLDHRTRAIARSAAEELTALEVPRATRLRGWREEVVNVAEAGRGRPDPRAPRRADAGGWRDREGTSEIDRSLLTGETVPVFAGEGQAVSAGEVNLTGPLTIRATAVGQDTSLHRMADLVASRNPGARAIPRWPTRRRSSMRRGCISCRRWPSRAGIFTRGTCAPRSTSPPRC